MTITFEDIERAATAIAGKVPRTPIVRASALSEQTGANVMLKLETLQTTNAFKVRGALNKLLSLTPDERKRGVIALSAGNHAQAVAFHATQLGIPATIVMPETTPWTKVERTSQFGGTVELAGETLAEARDHLNSLIEKHGLVLVHPYNDPLVMAGQGTVALEMLADAPDLDTLLVPIGGGGLISGMAVAARQIKPDIKIIGVEIERYPSMHAAINDTGAASGGSTLAEGIAVRDVGELAVEVCRKLVDDIVLVSEAAVEKAVATLLSQEKLLAEGAGAAGVAALLQDSGRWQGSNVGLVICGGNIDQRMLASLIVRELGRDKRVVSLRFRIEDRPGVLGLISSALGEQKANILEVHHQRNFLDVPAKGAVLEITIETRGPKHADEIIAFMRKQPYIANVSQFGAGE
ncbi:threonine ammonia-lyase [Anderseniella sp. Alg231-50]|uniref:threonine ammonia-lyase n=1 Tax=Anderseniella sp. Alg231-50 TaxID=1922226 RepID=UPI000D559635